MVQMAQRAFTVEDYLSMEDTGDIKHEYFAGSIYAMAGGTPNHNRIARSVLTALTTALRGGPCEPFGSDQRILTPSGLFTYPDVSVICGDIKPSDAREDTATNPSVIAEVLSSSTRDYDRGDKFDLYRAISTFQDYVLIEQVRLHVEVRSRTSSGQWTSTIFQEGVDTMEIPSLQFRMTLQDIYERVKLTVPGG